MASISKVDGAFRVQFTDADGARKTVRLGVSDRKTAESVCRHVEALLVAKTTGQPVRQETAVWLSSIGDTLRDRLAKVGLCEASAPSTTLGAFLADYIRRRPDVKATTVANWKRTVRVLLAYFGPNRPIASITVADATDFARWMRTPKARVRLHGDSGETLAEATIRRRCGIAKQFWNDAIERGLTTLNPFRKLPAAVVGNAARQRFITREETQRLLDVCPSPSWRLVVALARYAGLRCPSETHALEWSDIDWQRRRIRVRSPKTARHSGHEAREIPLFPELERYLLESWEACPKGETHCVFNVSPTNPGVHLRRLIKLAGLPTLPKPFVNMRGSFATELAQMYPGHVAAAWLGHSEAIANKHYRMVRDADYERAIGVATTGTKTGTVAAQNAAQQAAEINCTEWKTSSEALADFRLMPNLAERNLLLHKDLLGGIGLEPTTSTV